MQFRERIVKFGSPFEKKKNKCRESRLNGATYIEYDADVDALYNIYTYSWQHSMRNLLPAIITQQNTVNDSYVCLRARLFC